MHELESWLEARAPEIGGSPFSPNTPNVAKLRADADGAGVMYCWNYRNRELSVWSDVPGEFYINKRVETGVATYKHDVTCILASEPEKFVHAWRWLFTD
jgi:hypothetical protein